MKRKLNDDDIPEVTHQPSTANADTFDSFGLDARILQGIIKEKYSTPTLVQAKAIPLGLQGKSILARSKTGSGKTVAYVLPILQSILGRKAKQGANRATIALILVPTRELAGQVSKVIQALAGFCGQDIRVENLTRKEDERVQRARLANFPDIVVSTPGRAVICLDNSSLSLDSIKHLVIDEADLVLSYGYDDDLKRISKSLPSAVQTFMMSATLRAEIDTLKELFCKNPVIVELDEEEKGAAGVTQYTVKCAEDEKFLLVFAIFKLKLIKGKCIIFVDDIDRCYRLKLFLEQFGVRSCVLNSELPVNSRIHVVEEFNKNVYEIIIATDEHEILGDEGKEDEKRSKVKGKQKDATQESVPDSKTPERVDDADVAVEDVEAKSAGDTEGRSTKKRKMQKRDKEYGIARGIDFKNVACVLNFDLPKTAKSYTHRIGRTARAGKTGMALSFVIPRILYRKHKPTSIPSCQHDETVLAEITEQQEEKGHKIESYQFDMEKLAGFRYRMTDALRAVTRLAVREARMRELRQELLKSEKLKRHFEENPADLQHLRHDGELRAARIQAHLRHVPDYLLPGGAKLALSNADVGFVGFEKANDGRIYKGRRSHKMRGNSRDFGGRKVDPLKSFNKRRR
jgi:ATP-dependent RNA helicase DDX56/DBP9